MFLEEYSWLYGLAFQDGGWGTSFFSKASGSPAVAEEEEAMAAEVQFVAYGIVAPIILSIGVFGNLVVIFLLRLPRFKGVTYTYFLMLAVSDLLSLLFCISVLYHVTTDATLHYSTAVWYSYFELLFVCVPMSTGVFIVICITVDRHFSVCRPTDFKLVHNRRFAWKCMAVALLASVVAWVPVSFLREPRIAEDCMTSLFDPPDYRAWWVSCLVHDVQAKPYLLAYVWIRQTLVSFIPIVVLVTLNTLTLREFRRHNKRKQRMRMSETGQPSMEKREEDTHLVRLLLAVMTSFVITMVPAGICNAVNTGINTTKLNFVIFSAVANNLEILNHTLNFYLYILCSKPIRDVMKDYVSRNRPRIPSLKFDRFSLSREAKSESTQEIDRGGLHLRDASRRDTREIYVISTPQLSFDENSRNELMQQQQQQQQQSEANTPYMIQNPTYLADLKLGYDNHNYKCTP